MAKIFAEIFRTYDIELGRHSNIPECCIDYFINIIRPLTATERQTLRTIFPCEDYGYVRCPQCRLKNKIITVHKCDDNCKKFFEKIDEIVVNNYRKFF